MHVSTLLAAAIFTLCPLAAWAGTLEARLEALEKNQAELYHTLQERKSAGLMTKISEHISLSGLLEVEGAYERLSMRGEDDETASDLVVATAQLGLEAEVAESTAAISVAALIAGTWSPRNWRWSSNRGLTAETHTHALGASDTVWLGALFPADRRWHNGASL